LSVSFLAGSGFIAGIAVVGALEAWFQAYVLRPDPKFAQARSAALGVGLVALGFIVIIAIVAFTLGAIAGSHISVGPSLSPAFSCLIGAVFIVLPSVVHAGSSTIRLVYFVAIPLVVGFVTANHTR
jgi:hypothetical protein